MKIRLIYHGRERTLRRMALFVYLYHPTKNDVTYSSSGQSINGQVGSSAQETPQAALGTCNSYQSV